MHEAPLHRESIEKLRLAIQSDLCNVRELSADELKKRFPRSETLVAAWYFEKVSEQPPHDLIVAIDRQYPWSLPIIALPEKFEKMKNEDVKKKDIPHVGRDGMLCLFSGDVPYSLPVGIDHVREMFRMANELLEKGYSGANESDFFLEANSYWLQGNSTYQQIWITEEPTIKHAVNHSFEMDNGNIVVCDIKKKFSDGTNVFDQFMKTFLSNKSKERPALLIRLLYPLHPSKYPQTIGDVFALAIAAGATVEIKEALSRWDGILPMPVVIAFVNGVETVCLGGIFQPQKQIHFLGSRHKSISLFKLGKKQDELNDNLLRSNCPFPHMQVVPIYKKYLHDRTAGSPFSNLNSCHVMVIGCGALGGQLSVQLAQVGVGKMTLLDPDVLEWQNIGRHVLDMTYVGKNKAEALEIHIRKTFPDFEVTGINKSWRDVFIDSPEKFDPPDLVIYVGGKASDHLYLDELIENHFFPSAIFGWVEPFAVAAHAVFRYSCGRRVSGIFNSHGDLKEPVVDQNSLPPLPQEPSCGAFYQPYSSLHAIFGVSLIGELAVDALLGGIYDSCYRVWVGDSSSFHRNELSISQIWRTRLNKMGFNRRYDLLIPPSRRIV